ncbi:hypothetical protein [Deinococcus hohokamensis]|uniref:Uncharacterized protein n=1 Tax=Deinococcus hohokamensis TaxID=309883 RepID=A0ABV9IA28_9DEIO
MSDVEATRRAALRAVAEAWVYAAEAQRDDLLPELHALRAAYLGAPRQLDSLREVLDIALDFTQRLKQGPIQS